MYEVNLGFSSITTPLYSINKFFEILFSLDHANSKSMVRHFYIKGSIYFAVSAGILIFIIVSGVIGWCYFRKRKQMEKLMYSQSSASSTPKDPLPTSSTLGRFVVMILLISYYTRIAAFNEQNIAKVALQTDDRVVRLVYR